jgi:hypothetical protein
MSVSIALIPVTLAMRVVMGGKRFDEWVESMQIKIPTNFEDELDLVTTVKAAGYDCEPFFGAFKTHTQSSLDWFTWELVDGKWMAIFTTEDHKPLIAKMMRDLQTKAQRQIFHTDEIGKFEVVRTKTYPTNFSDGELLEQTLKQHGARVTRHPDGNLLAHFGSATFLHFNRTGDGPFMMEIPTKTEAQLAHSLVVRLDDTYREQVQKLTYQNLRQRIGTSDFSIESEEVLADKTIVITLNVQS